MNQSHMQYLGFFILLVVITLLLIVVFVCDNYDRVGIVVELFSTFVLACVPLCILNISRSDDKAKEEQNNRKESLEKMRVIIEQNYSMLDFESVGFVIRIMRFNQTQALDILFALLRQIEVQGHRYDLNMPYNEDENCVKLYSQTFSKCLKEYGHFINDLILVCYIQQMIDSNMCNKAAMGENIIALTKLFDISPEASQVLFSEHGLIGKLRDIPDNDNYVESVKIAIAERIEEISKLHIMKRNLSEAGMAIVESKGGELTM